MLWQLYPRGKNPGVHWTGGWDGCRAGLDAVAKRKIPILCRESNPDHPGRSLSLYLLSYHGSRLWRSSNITFPISLAVLFSRRGQREHFAPWIRSSPESRGSRSSSVSIVTGLRRTTAVRFLIASGKVFSSQLHPNRLWGPSSLLSGTGGLSTGVKRLGREAEHSPPSTADVKAWSIHPHPQYVFVAWCLIEQWMCLHGMVLG
jgi:hypothetical protein